MLDTFQSRINYNVTLGCLIYLFINDMILSYLTSKFRQTLTMTFVLKSFYFSDLKIFKISLSLYGCSLDYFSLRSVSSLVIICINSE